MNQDLARSLDRWITGNYGMDDHRCRGVEYCQKCGEELYPDEIDLCVDCKHMAEV